MQHIPGEKFSVIMNHTGDAVKQPISAPAIIVRVRTGHQVREYRFSGPFRIGRDESCELTVDAPMVSRIHAEVKRRDDQWVLCDLYSTNGCYVENRRVSEVTLTDGLSVALGADGPRLTFAPADPHRTEIADPSAAVSFTDTTAPADPLARVAERYFRDDDAGAGEHTRMIRRAFRRVQQQQQSRTKKLIALFLILLAGVSAYALYLHHTALSPRELAEQKFYLLKELELQIARLESAASEKNDPEARAVLAKNEQIRQEMSREYDQMMTDLHVYGEDLTEKQRLIMRIARIFGECELTMPRDFMSEVERFIAMWQSSNRLERAIRSAKRQGLPEKIKRVFLRYDLPPQFFYLALQESNFYPRQVGPPTRHGIAKGIWQFIPKTAHKYGLKTGPLVELGEYDPRDERHDFDKTTVAAARYIRDIYDTDAQASGFLVMAAYNWGEDRVISLLRQMPQNPRDRNFWKLLSLYRKKIPRETYDYVFYIISAAVIGENPRLFGFDFDNPLGNPATSR